MNASLTFYGAVDGGRRANFMVQRDEAGEQTLWRSGRRQASECPPASGLSGLVDFRDWWTFVTGAGSISGHVVSQLNTGLIGFDGGDCRREAGRGCLVIS